MPPALSNDPEKFLELIFDRKPKNREFQCDAEVGIFVLEDSEYFRRMIRRFFKHHFQSDVYRLTKVLLYPIADLQKLIKNPDQFLGLMQSKNVKLALLDADINLNGKLWDEQGEIVRQGVHYASILQEINVPYVSISASDANFHPAAFWNFDLEAVGYIESCDKKTYDEINFRSELQKIINQNLQSGLDRETNLILERIFNPEVRAKFLENRRAFHERQAEKLESKIFKTKIK
ncbi:MAG: hypothetical protein OHK0017_01090 [Patescibacteria group bacterium]